MTEHRVAPDILNPNWKYIPSTQTNIKERFEENGFKFEDSLYRKNYDFTGLDYWMWQITHKEESYDR